MEGLNPKQIGIDCLELIAKKLDKQMNPDEYYLALMDLQARYPLRGHWPPIGKEAMEDYKDRDLEPFNFKEAAEMYMWHQEKIEREKITGDWTFLEKRKSLKPTKNKEEAKKEISPEDEVPF